MDFQKIMITPDQITNGAVFKHGGIKTIIIDKEGSAADLLDIGENGMGLCHEIPIEIIVEWLNNWNATLCPELKLAVVEKREWELNPEWVKAQPGSGDICIHPGIIIHPDILKDKEKLIGENIKLKDALKNEGIDPEQVLNGVPEYPKS